MRCLPLADDCGIGEKETEDILRCIDAKSLRGASLLANGSFTEKAAALMGRRLAADPGLRAGAHLNLLEGKCSAAPASVPLLADASGRFRHSLGGLCGRLLFLPAAEKKEFIEQTAREWLAQITRIRNLLCEASGLEEVPLYLDGHQHVHAIPALRPALARVLDAFRFVHVRSPEEPRYACPAPLSLRVVGTARRELLAHWGAGLRRFLTARGVSVPDFFIGGMCSGSMTGPRLEAGLAAVCARARSTDLVEIMFHPGGADSGGGGKDVFSAFYAAPERAVEKNLLLSREYRELLGLYDPQWR
ncbi:MAG: ChbG/HpnK family deacetylase [Desulfovibrio sp.]|jgi:predicted glycoside hydrolase/deacetylase ChbG (UPF0249 family)|nr:ChbG/HpnK family deacetylase [Desulfovibrio sp.]